MQVELFNALQLILMVALVLCTARFLFQALRYKGFVPSQVILHSAVRMALAYDRELSVTECEVYHKFEIWRYYLFSR